MLEMLRETENRQTGRSASEGEKDKKTHDEGGEDQREEREGDGASNPISDFKGPEQQGNWTSAERRWPPPPEPSATFFF